MVYFSVAPPWRYGKDHVLLFIDVIRSCRPSPSVRVIRPDLGGFVSLICRSVSFKNTPSFAPVGATPGLQNRLASIDSILNHLKTSYNRLL